jgi:hypothetical protein
MNHGVSILPTALGHTDPVAVYRRMHIKVHLIRRNVVPCDDLTESVTKDYEYRLIGNDGKEIKQVTWDELVALCHAVYQDLGRNYDKRLKLQQMAMDYVPKLIPPKPDLISAISKIPTPMRGENATNVQPQRKKPLPPQPWKDKQRLQNVKAPKSQMDGGEESEDEIVLDEEDEDPIFEELSKGYNEMGYELSSMEKTDPGYKELHDKFMALQKEILNYQHSIENDEDVKGFEDSNGNDIDNVEQESEEDVPEVVIPVDDKDLHAYLVGLPTRVFIVHWLTLSLKDRAKGLPKKYLVKENDLYGDFRRFVFKGTSSNAHGLLLRSFANVEFFGNWLIDARKQLLDATSENDITIILNTIVPRVTFKLNSPLSEVSTVVEPIQYVDNSLVCQLVHYYMNKKEENIFIKVQQCLTSGNYPFPVATDTALNLANYDMRRLMKMCILLGAEKEQKVSLQRSWREKLWNKMPSYLKQIPSYYTASSSTSFMIVKGRDKTILNFNTMRITIGEKN